MNFQNYAVYDLRAAFSRQPGNPTRCLHCGEALALSQVSPSQTVKDHLNDFLNLYTTHDFSLLYFCENCHWWCIRESWSWREFSNADFDFIVVGVVSDDSPGESDEKPWLKPMTNPAIYENRPIVPKNIAVLFQNVSKSKAKDFKKG